MARRLGFVLLLGFLGLRGAAAADIGSRAVAESAFAEGVARYEEKNYAQALDAWRRVLHEGYGSTELFFNLGDAAYKVGELGWAIYYFEQARRRSPSDPDIASNLSLARHEALGTEATADRSILLDAIASVQNRWTLVGAIWVGNFLCWIAVAAIVVSWFRVLPRWASTLRWGALALVLCAFLLIGIKVFQGYLEPEALAVRSISARSEPSEEATVEFRLPAGSPVRLGRQAPGWHEVIVSTSLRGWVEASALEPFAISEDAPVP